MHFYKWTVIGTACMLLITGQAHSLQQPDPAQENTIRVTVDLVQVDAVVTNSKDEPVTDLTAEDFVVLQDGQPQQITNFSFIKADSMPSIKPEKQTSTGKDKSRPLPPPPPMPLKRQTVGRTIALLADDLGLSAEYAIRVRESVRQWIAQEMKPNDLVAVLRTGAGVGALHQFSNDKRLLNSAADLITYNATSRVSPISNTGGGTRKDAYGFALPMPDAERDLVFTKFTLGSIQYVVEGLKDLPGRKSIIVFSENLKLRFDACEGQSQGRDIAMQEPLRRLVDAANRASVVIHAIDPRGVVNTGNVCELLASQDGMAILAKQTGGLFISNRNDIDRALTTVADDGNGYYLIGYPPDAKTVSEMKKGRPKIHSIEVRVKRPGLRVRSRTEFFSAPDKKIAPDLLTRQERVGQALQSPFAGGDLRIRLTALFSQTKEEKSVINALLHFRADQLVFSEEPDGWHKAVIEITAGLFSSDGQQLDFADRTWNLTAKGKTYEYMQKNGVSFLMNVPVKDPGTYQMRLVLRDTATGQLGSATQVVEIPNIRDGKLALSGILLAANKTESEAAVHQEEGLIEKENTKKTAAVRIFESGETIAWAYQILNAKADKKNKPQIVAQIRLFKEGREVYQGPQAPLNSPEGGTKRMIAADQIHLKQLPAGYYVLQIAVTDTLAKEKQRIAVQSIDFDAENPEAK